VRGMTFSKPTNISLASGYERCQTRQSNSNVVRAGLALLHPFCR